MSKKRKPQRVNLGDVSSPDWRTIKEYAVDLGSGGRGLRRYKVLKHLLRDVIASRKGGLEYEDANTVYMWAKTSRLRIALKSPFIVYLEADEWGALSRGLRALGTPAANTMYDWIVAHRTTEYES